MPHDPKSAMPAARKTTSCPGYITAAGQPNGCQSKLPAGHEICITCANEIRQHIETNTPNNQLPKSSRPVMGVRGEQRRQAQQPATRTWGTPDGAVSNTSAATVRGTGA